MTLETRARETAVEIVSNIFWTPGRRPSNRERRLVKLVTAALAERDQEIERLKEHLTLEAAHFRELYGQHQVFRAQRDALVEVLEQAKGCIQGLLSSVPVRDADEVLVVIDVALAAGKGE